MSLEKDFNGQRWLTIEENSEIAKSGGSNWELVGSGEFTISTTSTTDEAVGNVSISNLSSFGANDIIWVHIRDKAGKRNGYFYGSDHIFLNVTKANGSESSITGFASVTIYVNSGGTYQVASGGTYGVKATQVSFANSNTTIKARYFSTYGTINGTFKCDVYKLTSTNDMTMFK